MWYRNWRDPSWLAAGNVRQQRALDALVEIQIFERLADFDPVLAGTIPLDIDIPGSDLDIICCAPDAMAFATTLTDSLSHHDGFLLRRAVIRGDLSTIALFQAAGHLFEIFGQATPVAHQPAVVHLDVEAQLLAAGGEHAREIIRSLKMSGLKTEPAFAQWLGIEGDPFDALYALGSVLPERIARMAHEANDAWQERRRERD